MLTRRDWLSMTLAAAASTRWVRAQAPPRGERERRILDLVQAYSDQGEHRTGTDADRVSAEWLRDEIRRRGLTPALEPFALQRVDVGSAALVARDRRIDGLFHHPDDRGAAVVDAAAVGAFADAFATVARTLDR